MFSCIKDDEVIKWGKNLDRNRERKSFFHMGLFKNRTRNIFSFKPRYRTYERRIKQNVTIKFSYTRQHTTGAVADNTRSAIAYAYKLDGTEGFGNFYGKKQDNVSEQQAQDAMKGKKLFKLVISPENPELANKEYIRCVMSELEKLVGRKLSWVATVHDDTDHKHVHVVISREDGDGLDFEHPLYIDPNIIKKDLRDKAMNIATIILGYLRPEDINRKQFFEIPQKGYTSLDTLISKGISMSGYFADKELKKYPMTQRVRIKKRLEVLASFDIGIKRVADGYIFEKDWKTRLYTQKKVSEIMPEMADGKKYSDVIVAKDQKLDERHPIKGKIIAKKAVDEINDRVGFIIKGDDGKTYYHEQVMNYEKYKQMGIGTRINLSWKGIKNKKVSKSYEILDMDMEA